MTSRWRGQQCLRITTMFRIFIILTAWTASTNADLLVGTSFKRPKVPVFTNYGFETEFKVGSSDSKISDDEIGLKPMKPVLYSSRPSDKSYVSSDKHDPRGMEHLYVVTEMFLGLIQSEDIPPEISESKTIDEVIEKVKADNGMALMKNFVGMSITAAIGLLIGITIPLVGLIFCCCRCAGRCGGGKEVVEKPHDVFKKAILGILMFLLVIVMLFGIVCAFVTNEYIEKGLTELPYTYNSSIDDIQLYLKNTRNAVNSLLKDNYGELNIRLDETLDRSGDIVKNRLGKATEAFAINNLTDIVSGLEKVRDELRNVSEKTELIQSLSAELQIGLSEKREELLGLLSRCQRRQCDIIRSKYDIGSLTVTENFKQLPNVTNAAREISSLIQDDIVSEVKRGKREFDDISLRIQKEVQNIIPEIKKRISKVGLRLRNASDNITQIIEGIDLRPFKSDVGTLENFQAKYGRYRWYVYLGLCSVILLVTILLIFGLFCGICGKNPGNIYGDDSCNKGTGANCILMAISIIIILALFMMIIDTSLFLIGGLSRQLFCHPAQDFDNPSFLKMIDTHLAGNRLTTRPSEALKNCHRNKTIYDVLNLGAFVNISDIQRYREELEVDKKLEEFLKQIKINPDVNILTDVAKRQLQKLADSDLTSINFTAYSVTLQNQITPVNISELANELENLSQALFGIGNLPRQLKTRALELQIYQPRYVEKIKSTLASLIIDAKNLQRDMKFNQSSFRDAIYYLITTVEKAQDYIRTNGRREVDTLANSFVKEFTSTIDTYTNHLQNKVENSIGRCWPVSSAINASITATCKNVLLPFNGFWTSVGWCLILWLPLLIIGVMLSILYRRTDPYTGALVESDTFDSYLDRDNIPLANVEKKRRRKKRRHESYDNRNAYVPDYSPMSDYAAGDSDRRRRSRPRSNGYMPAPTSSEDTTPNTPGTAPGFGIGIISSSQAGSAPPEYLEKPPPYYYPGP